MMERNIETVQVGEEGGSSCYGSCCGWLKNFSPREKETMTTMRKPHSHHNILNLITGEVFETLICSRFLLPEDIASLLQVDGIFNSYTELRKNYCKIHGTKLDLTYEDYLNRNYHRNHRHREDFNDDETMIRANESNNNDVQFLIWSLEQQAFISAAPSLKDGNGGNVNDIGDDEPPSLCPDCLDCRMARFESKKKCPCCNHYIFHEWVNTICEGKCQKIVCESCGSYSCQADDCDNKKPHCDTCFDGYYCEPCNRDFHEKCRTSSECGECSQRFCFDCTLSGYVDSFTCNECKLFFCMDCKDNSYCFKCENSFCIACKDSFFCVFCEETFCPDCDVGIHCSLCGEPSCSNCCMTYFCNGCNTFHCEGCRDKFTCKYCKNVYCSQHEDHFDECERSYKNVLIRAIQRGL